MSRGEWLEQKRQEFVGKTFGEVTVIAFDHTDNRRIYYKCKCNRCGNEFVTRKDMLKSGHTTSCGCVKTAWMHSGNLNKKHGLYKERAYWVWCKIKARCYNPNCREYSNYGGRGIKICDEWLHDPKAFCEWAYAHGYDKDAPKGQCTIDRIDVNGNYEPSNCRFITNLEQQNNRRDCRKFEYKGEIHTMAEWARIYNVPYPTMASYLKSGHSLDYFENDYVPRKRYLNHTETK